jgi:acetolactate synthase regulatory subunit
MIDAKSVIIVKSKRSCKIMKNNMAKGTDVLRNAYIS